METKKDLKKLIAEKAIKLHEAKKEIKNVYREKGSASEGFQTLKSEIVNTAHEVRHLYVVYGQLHGLRRHQIERNHRLAKPLQEGFISQLMAKYL